MVLAALDVIGRTLFFSFSFDATLRGGCQDWSSTKPSNPYFVRTSPASTIKVKRDNADTTLWIRDTTAIEHHRDFAIPTSQHSGTDSQSYILLQSTVFTNSAQVRGFRARYFWLGSRLTFPKSVSCWSALRKRLQKEKKQALTPEFRHGSIGRKHPPR